ncbi:hypothetical protein POM88_051943 [Heracleum sosnowskyi]|uniref:Uncharacterized protein n=1 Tax=Heracleum sosnowskyi TaxID=360622 RepID=A0AAD8GS70_9APIA|nr:hypothetical protein POM88_051934 [Heracleum sosnowskyi]KAK1353570.1 hypothetical protein POM88_051935 [Heracleum sosnowskyi]KAK1353571.1 hypothetical protein POM88_051936 [Heracleum sosnowskyi]KAK1353572.1 hypothetical protein POM88_051937 [Heracleum sosnowskyi]KAK1353573.1 hypothetical protein POM88_051938 [Heracleum sosnowskyi]
MARLPRGRKRIPIQKIETKSNLEEAEDNIFAFGEPSVEQILDTFMNQNLDEQNGEVDPFMEDHEDPVLSEPKEEEMMEYKASIQAEKTRENTITELPDPRQENFLKKWWLTPVEDLTLDEAEKMLEELEEFKHSIDSKGMHRDTSSSRQTTEVSLLVPHGGGGFTLTPHSYLASTSKGLEHCDKGKAPMQD